MATIGRPVVSVQRVHRERRVAWASARLHSIALVFCAEALAILLLAKTQPDFGRQLGRWIPLPATVTSTIPDSPAYNYDNKLDPKIGLLAPRSWLRTVEGNAGYRRVFLHNTVAMLFVGMCSSCALTHIAPWLKLTTRSPRQALVVVTTSDLNGARWLSGRVGPRVTVLRDVGMRTTESYNAAWVPRAYVVREDGILSFCQSSQQSLTDACLQVQRRLNDSGPKEAEHGK